MATQVALDILKEGDNAIDAAITANAILSLVEPTGRGIVWDELQKLLMMGHKTQWDLGGYGGYQAIRWDAKKVFISGLLNLVKTDRPLDTKI